MHLAKYLTEFYRKTHPLSDFKTEVDTPFQEMFEEEWQNGSLYGWEVVLAEFSATEESKDNAPGVSSNSFFFCKPCQKSFEN